MAHTDDDKKTVFVTLPDLLAAYSRVLNRRVIDDDAFHNADQYLGDEDADVDSNRR